MNRARDAAAASAGLLILSNLLAAVFHVDGAAWFALRVVLAVIMTGALVAVAWIWLSRRRRRTVT